ncbi:MAG TPA: diguanylate cyclase [Galbitalea sp.]|jgi:diguanylate cyclase (GGDEF)-like protein/PAS domain S-box-containing protein|nr:diguanylate cyclase [Galbitalea sp.]
MKEDAATPVDPIEDSYETLYEQAPCGFLSMTPSGTILKVNRTLLDWTGYERDEVVGKSLSGFLDKGSQLFYETRYIPVLRLEREVREVVMTIRRADGSLLPILVNSVLVSPDPLGPEVIRTAVFDSTARRDYELELLHSRQAAQASEARVRVLQDAANEFAECNSEAEVAAALVERARAAFAATETAMFFLGDGGSLDLVAGYSPIVDLVPLDSLRPAPESIRRGQFIGLSSLEEAMDFSPEVADALLATRLEAMTVTPLIDGAGPIGVLTCFYGRARRFDDDFRQLQVALAVQAAQVLGRLRLQSELQHAALHDQLTGLANRALLQERMDEAIAVANRADRPLSVLFLDLDGFKAVNDYLGHAIGDSVLREVASRLRSEVRAGDVVGRFGGDEFIVLCPDTDEADAVGVAERIRASVGRPFDAVLPQFPVTVSIGIAVHGGGSRTTDAMFTAADEAMYRSKNAGKDCVTVALG